MLLVSKSHVEFGSLDASGEAVVRDHDELIAVPAWNAATAKSLAS